MSKKRVKYFDDTLVDPQPLGDPVYEKPVETEEVPEGVGATDGQAVGAAGSSAEADDRLRAIIEDVDKAYRVSTNAGVNRILERALANLREYRASQG